MWKKLERDDKSFLVIIAGISLFCSLVIIGVYFYCHESKKGDISFLLSVFGTAVTVVALLFSIYQQIKIKKTSELINESTKKLYENIKSNYHALNFNRAISLANDIEGMLRKKEYHASIALIRQLQETLGECKKIYILDFKKEIYMFINCMDQHKGKSFEEIIKECECKCEKDSLNKLIKLNKNISSEYVSLNSKLAENQQNIEIKNLANVVIQLRNHLTDIKPTPLNFANF